MKGKFIKGEYLKVIIKLLDSKLDELNAAVDKVNSIEGKDYYERVKLRQEESGLIEGMWECRKIKEYIEK